MFELTPEEAKVVKEAVRLISRYPEVVRALLAAHDSMGGKA